MKTKILAKIALASSLCAPSCCIERGVVIDRQNLPEEKALYVNLIRADKSKQKPLHIQSDEVFDADRKLFFMDTTYLEPFVYVAPGDTISFYNATHKTYLHMGQHGHRVRNINGIRMQTIARWINTAAEHQK